MINLVRWLAIKSTASGRIFYVEPKRIDKFENNYDFKVDIFVPENARVFLQSLEYDGEKLPTHSPEGEPYVYNLFVRGRSRSMPFINDKNGRPSPMYNLFPGYTKDGKQLEKFPNGVVE